MSKNINRNSKGRFAKKITAGCWTQRKHKEIHMATLAHDLTTKLHQSVKAEGLTFRNWSGPDAWVFAIYSEGEGDNYVGCVEVVESTRTMQVHVSNKCRPIRHEAEILGKLCDAFNRL